MPRRNHQGLVAHAADFRGLSRRWPFFPGAGVAGRGGDGGGSDVDNVPDPLPSSATAGTGDDGLGSGNYAGLDADRDDDSSAKTASGVHSGVPAEGRAGVGKD